MTLEEALQEIAELKAKNADISRNLVALRKSAEQKEDELTWELEKVRKESEKAIADKTKELETFTTTIEEEKKAQRTAYLDKKLEEMSKGDNAIADKLRAEYGLINIPEDNEEAINTRLDKARTIAFAWQNWPTGVGEASGAGSGVSGWSGGTSDISPNTAALLAAAWVK